MNTSDHSQQTPATVPTYDDTPQPSPKKSIWLKVIIGLCIALLLIGAGGYYAYSRFNNAATEEEAYKALEGSYAIQSYEDFIAAYPNGKYSREVTQRLADLKAKNAAWMQIANSVNTQDFVLFKTRFQDAYYDKLCDRKIDSLDWINAQQTNDPDLVQLYLENHPSGIYAAQAKAALAQAEDKYVMMEAESDIKDILNSFFSAFGDNDGAEMCRYITPKMDNFLGRKNITKSEVINVVDHMFGSSIEACQFNVNRDLKVERAIGANGAKGYKATVSVDQHIYRHNSGKTFGSYSVEALFNEELMMTSLLMKEISQIKQVAPAEEAD